MQLRRRRKRKMCKLLEKKMKKYIIKVEKEKEKNEIYVIRNLTLINNQTKEEKKIIQIHFKGWPDHGIPDKDDEGILQAFIEMNKIVDENKKDGPIIVHCSAGVGRTGTFISMYFLEKEIRNQLNDPKVKNIKVNIFNFVRKLKEMRLYLVQSDLQYYYIYIFVNYLLNNLNK
jgi:protein tyrosine phosphatase